MKYVYLIKQILFIFWIMLLNSVSLFSQNNINKAYIKYDVAKNDTIKIIIKGKVIDSTTFKPIQGLYVYIVANDGYFDSDTTNINGYYIFSLHRNLDYKIYIQDTLYKYNIQRISTNAIKKDTMFIYDFKLKR